MHNALIINSSHLPTRISHLLSPTLGLTGIFFPTQPDAAYCAQRIWLAIGFTIGFVTAEFLSVNSCVWSTLGAVLLALISVVIIQLSKFRHTCWRHHKCSPKSNSSVAGLYSNSADTAVREDEVKGLPSVDEKCPSHHTNWLIDYLFIFIHVVNWNYFIGELWKSIFANQCYDIHVYNK